MDHKNLTPAAGKIDPISLIVMAPPYWKETGNDDILEILYQ
jgi:hypothetical protein